MNFDYCNRMPFKNGEVEALKKAYDIIISKSEWYDAFCNASTVLLEGKIIKEECDRLMQACGVHSYTILVLVLIESLEPLENRYKELGYDQAFFEGVVLDIYAKTIECNNVYGIVGAVCYDWYVGFYDCTRLCLGRLQFEKRPLKHGYGDLKEGDTVVNCHIPSLGPLDYDKIINSFKMAYQYFADVARDGVLPIVCSSWLLYSKTARVYKKGGGLETFYNMFDVVYEAEDDTNRNFWRIFDCEYKYFDKAPTDTSLRRDLYAQMKTGINMGSGYGVILFDGEKVINK